MTELGQPRRIVVVGAGLAGLRTVEELRAVGYQGSLTLVGAEARMPYDRPPLTKKVMTGEVDDTTLRLDLGPLNADVRLGETATGLAGQLLSTDRGEHAFDRLVLATGARPVMLPGPGPQRLLRTIDDALALRTALVPGVRLAIVGAGWIGAELATTATARGCRVTVVEAAGTPLAAAVGPQVGALTAGWYGAAGVDLRLGTAVASVQDGGLALADGGGLAADEIVTAVGVRPDVGWLAGSGLALDNGVAVDDALRASVPGVFAVGDCAAFWSRRYQRRLRTEHWDGALRGPAALARVLLAGTGSYDPVPYFWSEQFGRMVQYAGFHGGADRMVLRGNPAARRWAACWLAGPRLVALLTVSSPRDLVQGRRMIEAGTEVDAARLADPEVAIRDTAVS